MTTVTTTIPTSTRYAILDAAAERATINESGKVVPGNVPADSGFGVSAAQSGTTLVVGARGDRAGTTTPGAVFAFTGSGTSFAQTDLVRPADTMPGDLFGYAVALDGDVLVASAPWAYTADEQSGAVYVLERDAAASWNLRAKLNPADLTYHARFGWSLRMTPDRLLVGATLQNNSGAVYVYARSGATFTQSQVLTGSGATPAYQFGATLGFDGVTLAVACYRDSNVYVFASDAQGTLSQTQQIALADAGIATAIDFNVDVAGDWLAAGAADEQTAVANHNGVVEMFQRVSGTYIFTQTLSPSNRASIENFGAEVRFVGADVLLVGTMSSIGSEVTPVYVFRRQGTTWVETDQLLGSDVAVTDGFGAALVPATDSVLVGAPYQTGSAPTTGALYVFGALAGPSPGTGGAPATGGGPGTTGGSSAAGSAGTETAPSGSHDSAGCGCGVPGTSQTPGTLGALALALLACARRGLRQRGAPRRSG